MINHYQRMDLKILKQADFFFIPLIIFIYFCVKFLNLL